MAPPVPVLPRSQAEQLFEAQNLKDCILKEISQYECSLNGEYEIICLPFTRLFKECTVTHTKKSSKVPGSKHDEAGKNDDNKNKMVTTTTRQMFEITDRDTNEPFRNHKTDLKEFVRTNERLSELAEFYDQRLKK